MSEDQSSSEAQNHSQELKPCPFCGSKGTLHAWEEGREFAVGCVHDCAGHRSRHKYVSRENAIREWNSRPTPVSVEGLRTIVEEGIDRAYRAGYREDLEGRDLEVDSLLSKILDSLTPHPDSSGAQNIPDTPEPSGEDTPILNLIDAWYAPVSPPKTEGDRENPLNEK